METQPPPYFISTLRAMGGCYSIAFRRMALSRFMIAEVLLVFSPVVVALLASLLSWGQAGLAEVHGVYEAFLQTLFMNFVVFFSASVIGFSLLRQDFEEQTLHYLLLQPVPRWAVVAGRMLAFLTLSGLLCAVSLWGTYLIMALHVAGFSGVIADLFGAGRFSILLHETGIMTMGLVIYGTFAMLMATFVRTALYSILLLGWEVALPYLPSSLKFFTAAQYMHSLFTEKPIAFSAPIFELLGTPASLSMSLTVLGLASLLFFLSAAWMFQRRECLYGET